MMGSGGCLGAMVHRLDCLRYLFAIYFLDLDVAIRAMKCYTSHLSTNSVNEELLLRTVPRLVTYFGCKHSIMRVRGSGARFPAKSDNNANALTHEQHNNSTGRAIPRAIHR
jgi:hypothetical protein